jgi:hypothetical protein
LVLAGTALLLLTQQLRQDFPQALHFLMINLLQAILDGQS